MSFSRIFIRIQKFIRDSHEIFTYSIRAPILFIQNKLHEFIRLMAYAIRSHFLRKTIQNLFIYSPCVATNAREYLYERKKITVNYSKRRFIEIRDFRNK